MSVPPSTPRGVKKTLPRLWIVYGLLAFNSDSSSMVASRSTPIPRGLPLVHSVYLSTREAAVRPSIGSSTLKKLRVNGGGPAFHRIGQRVVYSIEILDERARRATFESTSEYRRGVC
jgi:hypothetical protein